MRNPAGLQEAAHQFRVLDRGGSHEDRLSSFETVRDLVGNGPELLPFRPENDVGEILPDHRAVGGELDDFEPVDLLEFFRFGGGRTCHARQFAVHPEVVLEGDGRQRLVLAPDLHPLLRFDGLVKTF